MEVKEVAERLQVHPTSVRRYIRSGRLPATAQETPQGIRYLVSDQDFEQFLKQQSVPADTHPVEPLMHDLNEQVAELTDTIGKHLRDWSRDNHEVWRALENLTQMVSDVQARLEHISARVSVLTDDHVKERDQQLVYTMKALRQEKKRKGLFSRI